jgi:hypothetical protein
LEVWRPDLQLVPLVERMGQSPCPPPKRQS